MGGDGGAVKLLGSTLLVVASVVGSLVAGCAESDRYCGDGAIQSGEACDDGNLVNGDRCENDCSLPRCGNDINDLGEECDDGNDDGGDGCSAECVREGPTVTCGDRVIDPGEVCDDGNELSGDGCRGDCLGLEHCGDGLLDQGAPLESVRLIYRATDCNPDLGSSAFHLSLNGATFVTPPISDDCRCRSDAVSVTVTDADFLAALVEGGELSISIPTDGTVVGWAKLELGAANGSATIVLVDATEIPGPGGFNAWRGERDICQFGNTTRGFTERVVVKSPIPEACDDGNDEDGDGCRSDCTVGYCGDGTLDDGEDCDDGDNIQNEDDCPADCTFDLCGDGSSDDGIRFGEECDDGDIDDEDFCHNDCTRAECRDGVIDIGTESCDDGNLNDGDGCSWNCLSELCGNGDIDPGEVCDDGDTNSRDGCRWDCFGLEVCGDGLLDFDEECDDGNQVDDDACSNDCVESERGRCQRDEPIPYSDADEDLDGLSDCADPDCADSAACVPGDGTIGTRCRQHGDCESTGMGPSCTRLTDQPGGVCSGPCDPDSATCGSNGRCVGTTSGTCYAVCDEPADCLFGWTCRTVLGEQVCMPQSTDPFPVELQE